MIPAGSLEDAEALEAGDPGGMLRLVASGAAHLRRAAGEAEEAGLAEALRGAGRPRSVVVCGPGSAGEVVAAVCGPGCPVPVLTVAGGRLPGWVGVADLVFALGDEAFALAEEAVRRGASVVGVGPAGARLAQLAVQSRSLYLPVPPGPVRALLWAQVVPMLLVLRGLRLVSLPDEALESTALLMEDLCHRCRPSGEPFLSPGKQPALELAGALPMPWGETPVELAAARRFAAQLGDNAKVPSAGPQLGALDRAARRADPDDFFRDRGDDEEPGVHLVVFVEERPSPVAEVARARGVPVTEIRAEGGHSLERVASLIVICDYVSVYLALALGVDPTPVPARAELTARIS